MRKSHQGWIDVEKSPVLHFFQGENWNQDADLDTILFPTKKGNVANPTDDSNKNWR